jgi:hypothetical protein
VDHVPGPGAGRIEEVAVVGLGAEYGEVHGGWLTGAGGRSGRELGRATWCDAENRSGLSTTAAEDLRGVFFCE